MEYPIAEAPLEVSPTRKQILQHLLMQSYTPTGHGSSIKRIAKELNLSINTIRQHLTILEKEDLVFRKVERGKTGRPAIVYYLHDNAFETFPKVYVEFALDLIEEVESEYGTGSLVSILDKIGVKIANRIIEEIERNYQVPDFKDLSTKERLEYICKIFDYYGKYPDLVEEEDSFAMLNYNCLVYKLTKANMLVCRVDEAILRELIGQPVKKELCLREGDRYCLYRIFKKP
ncbi:MAG: helix-turn-helix transcriptional regulator [Promethearchaeota archaeon]